MHIPAGIPAEFDGATVGRMLGRGMFGSVHTLQQPSGVPVPDLGEVVKIIDKKGVTDFQDLSCMKRMIDVMQLLSSDRWQHPNLIKLYQVIHTRSHICLRMESGGDFNLHKRLQMRETVEGRLSYQCVVELLQQLAAVVAHLHLGPSVCHRDIKPENCIIHEHENRIQMKLADFDLAMIQNDQTMCRSACGTLPFTAPEVLLENQYCGKTADIWSLGVVFFEILCGVRIIEQVLALSEEEMQGADPRNPGRPNTAVAMRIRSAFQRQGSVAEILEGYIFPDLQDLRYMMAPWVNDLLHVDVSQRLRASHLAERSAPLAHESNR